LIVVEGPGRTYGHGGQEAHARRSTQRGKQLATSSRLHPCHHRHHEQHQQRQPELQ
jgi:hypothetical protein